MPTLTWTGKEDALRTASLVPFRLLEPHPALEGGSFGDPKAALDKRLRYGIVWKIGKHGGQNESVE